VTIWTGHLKVRIDAAPLRERAAYRLCRPHRFGRLEFLNYAVKLGDIITVHFVEWGARDDRNELVLEPKLEYLPEYLREVKEAEAKLDADWHRDMSK
jgi:hypothetical protein